MGHIDELVANAQGVVREAVVILLSHRKIRKPLNLLIPLELDDDDFDKKERQQIIADQADKDPTREKDGSIEKIVGNPPARYNLRPKRNVDYAHYFEPRLAGNTSTPLFLIIGVFLIGGCIGSNSLTVPQGTIRQIRCILGGVQLTSSDCVPYEICVEEFCKTYETPNVIEIVKFPPQLILHEHEVQWKFVENTSVRTMETNCPPAPSCDNVDCTICTMLIFYPECWPVGAIVASALISYFFLTGCYVFLYVLLVIGRPIRAILCGLGHISYLLSYDILDTQFGRNLSKEDDHRVQLQIRWNF